MFSALAAPPWCVSSARLGAPAVSTRCPAAGCPSGVPLLATLFRMADRPGSAPLPPMSWELWVLHRGAGGGLLLPDLRVSGSGCRLLPDPFWRLSVPPLAGLEGQGCRDLGCRGAAAGLLSALPRHSSCSIVLIPMPYSSPISITGAALEKISLVLVAKDALELAPLPSPGFYSHLLVVL